jgi:hypothetical protein
VAGDSGQCHNKLAIRSEAVRVARRILDLQGAERLRPLEQEREFLELAERAERGEEVTWPTSTEYRMTTLAAPPTEPPVAIVTGDLNQIYGFLDGV